jgi:hypothetical protein
MDVAMTMNKPHHKTPYSRAKRHMPLALIRSHFALCFSFIQGNSLKTNCRSILYLESREQHNAGIERLPAHGIQDSAQASMMKAYLSGSPLE